ncbi:MAG: alpha-amylase family glycosyl hydrolase [Candidatus Manganitrophus sp.]|nr:MAG: alpha-amylase family glycosyl hydrolase [Candidatus Manganitrophus sp.]
MNHVRYPSLYQINTPVYLGKLSRNRQCPATLDDIPDSDLDALSERGFDWIWFLGVWQTGAKGREVSRSIPEWRREFQGLLPDFSEEDITGSFFSVVDYSVHSHFGGDPALARLRKRLKTRGLKLLLDFIPNHTARDHRWVQERPDFYVSGNEADLSREPGNYTRVSGSGDRADRIMAYGRDPYFPGWSDTFQLNYGHPPLQEAMTGELLKIAERCDGVRCDMAMLLLPEVFERTWGIKAAPFWLKAIRAVRERSPDFLFMAEVYWDLEWTLQHQGFDYCYDKRLYDRLREGQARPVREHLWAGLDFQDRLARFLENHDEPRAAAVFPPKCTAPPRSSPSFHPVCVSSTRESWKAISGESRSTYAGDRRSRSMERSPNSTAACSPV